MNRSAITLGIGAAVAIALSASAPISASTPDAAERNVVIELDYSCRGAVGTVTFTGGAGTMVASSYVPGEVPESGALVDAEPGEYPAGTAPLPSGTVVTAWALVVYADGETVTSAVVQGVIPDGC